MDVVPRVSAIDWQSGSKYRAFVAKWTATRPRTNTMTARSSRPAHPLWLVDTIHVLFARDFARLIPH
jgi:hypothetical protein